MVSLGLVTGIGRERHQRHSIASISLTVTSVQRPIGAGSDYLCAPQIFGHSPHSLSWQSLPITSMGGWYTGTSTQVVDHNSSTFILPTGGSHTGIRHPILYMTSSTLLETNSPKLYAHLVPAFVTLLALGGQVGLPILVLTCLRFKRLNRHSTFVNCCVASIIYSLVFCILLSRFPPFSLLLSHSDFGWSLSSPSNSMYFIEYIPGNIAVRSLIMLFVLHRHLWSWPFSRCAFAFFAPHILRCSHNKTDRLCRVSVAVLMFVLQVQSNRFWDKPSSYESDLTDLGDISRTWLRHLRHI